MKEATGELNMTVVTVVAIVAVGAFLYAFVLPSIQKSIRDNTCRTECGNDTAVAVKDENAEGGYSCQCTPES